MENEMLLCFTDNEKATETKNKVGVSYLFNGSNQESFTVSVTWLATYFYVFSLGLGSL